MTRHLAAVPDPEPEPDRWRIAGHRLPVPMEFPPGGCTRNPGLCPLCHGAAAACPNLEET